MEMVRRREEELCRFGLDIGFESKGGGVKLTVKYVCSI